MTDQPNIIAYAIEARRTGDAEWKALAPSSAGVITELEEVSCLAFETRPEAEAFIAANRPPGYEARIVELSAVAIAYRGRHDA